MRRMFQEQEDVFYYLTVMNENYEHPEMPVGAEADIIKGMYAFKKGGESAGPRVQLLGSGTIFREVIAAADLLKNDWGVESDLWGCPSFNELARDGQDDPALELLHPLEEPKLSHVEQKLAGAKGPVIAATDYIKLFAEQIRPFVKAPTSRWAPTVSAVPTPAKAASLLRGRSSLGDAGCPQGTGRRRRDRA
jgi:pyruvate dehydrogenase E1 component